MFARRGERIASRTCKTFLFREPDYLRIRLYRGGFHATITKKRGSYQEKGRWEDERIMPLSALGRFLEQIRNEGYRECTGILAHGEDYRVRDLTVSLNDIEFLGRIVEVEAITDIEGEIPRLHAQATAALTSLGLTPLDADAYQRMMQEMYRVSLKPVSEQDFNV